jgi:antibiotic biosynthesis monooxygenase (ABM) superfamily enzyme
MKLGTIFLRAATAFGITLVMTFILYIYTPFTILNMTFIGFTIDRSAPSHVIFGTFILVFAIVFFTVAGLQALWTWLMKRKEAKALLRD